MHTEPHRWLIEHRHRETWLSELVEIRERVESMSDTQLTFTLGEMTDSEGRLKPLLEDALPHLGCWIVPDHIGDGQRDRYVNPHAPDSWLYGEGVVRCRCGTLTGDHRTRPDQWASSALEHNDGCTREWREEAYARLDDCRWRIYAESINVALPAELVAKRAGMSEEEWLRWVQSKGLDYREARALGRLRAVATWRVLRDVWDHSLEEIASAFGTDTQTVRLLLGADVDVQLTQQR